MTHGVVQQDKTLHELPMWSSHRLCFFAQMHNDHGWSMNALPSLWAKVVLWLLRLSHLCLLWNAICFLSENVKKKNRTEQELRNLLACKCAPEPRFGAPLSVAIIAERERRCSDSLRETWHLGDNRSVYLQLFFSFSVVQKSSQYSKGYLNGKQLALCPVLWQSLRKCPIWLADSQTNALECEHQVI